MYKQEYTDYKDTNTTVRERTERNQCSDVRLWFEVGCLKAAVKVLSDSNGDCAFTITRGLTAGSSLMCSLWTRRPTYP
ncbi:hypothetical protein AALO_G00141370 [Alosa alosa]|uniref:Uncharacterized protein n=1 Tax=Alosa alosa TaxID=278164 RepID=A0AAV6GJA9_9TELE|nr:hypothetical protein AALO_G00141370 [Alosa alosa]